MYPCRDCGKERTYTQAEINRGRPTLLCQPCSVKAYNATRPPKKTKAMKLAYQRAWVDKNRERQNQYRRAWTQETRATLIASFGGQCNWCGEDDPIVLDFDHVADDGHLDRGGSNIIFAVQRDPSRFQLLCKNCNWRKEHARRQHAGSIGSSTSPDGDRGTPPGPGVRQEQGCAQDESPSTA